MKNHDKHRCWLAMKLHNQPRGQCSLAEYIATHPYESKGIDSEGETTRASSPASYISSLSDDGSTTGPDDDSIGSNSPRSTSSKSSTATKNTGNTTSSDNSKRSSVLEKASFFGETVQRGGAPSKGPKGQKK